MHAKILVNTHKDYFDAAFTKYLLDKSKRGQYLIHLLGNAAFSLLLP